MVWCDGGKGGRDSGFKEKVVVVLVVVDRWYWW